MSTKQHTTTTVPSNNNNSSNSSSSNSTALKSELTPCKIFTTLTTTNTTTTNHHGSTNSTTTACRTADKPSSTTTTSTQPSPTTTIDFIGPAASVKDLFAIPYSTDLGVSVAVHKIGGTILLDSGHGGLVAAASSKEEESSAADSSSPSSSDGGGGLHQHPTSTTTTTTTTTRQQPRGWNWNNNSSAAVDGHFLGSVVGAPQQTKPLLPLSSSSDENCLVDNKTNDIVASVLRQLAIVADDDGDGTTTTTATSTTTSTTMDVSRHRVSSQSLILSVNNRDSSSSSSNNDKTRKTFQDVKKPHDYTNEIIIHPPEHYAGVALPAPREPRQWLNFQYNDMRLLVASDALIYRSSAAASSAHHSNIRPTPTEGGGVGSATGESSSSPPPSSPPPSSSQALILRIADKSEMKAQQDHLSRITTKESLSKSSYADVVTSSTTTTTTSSSSSPITTPTKQEPTEQQQSLMDIVPSMQLQTCIIPSQPLLSCPPPCTNTTSPNNTTTTTTPSSPIITCLDAYLDNIISSVPQLALCLQEKGFISSVRLLNTEDIPHSLFPSPQPIFSPSLVDLNATLLLRFLKDNCNDNCTYLLHRNPHERHVKLYDVTALSTQRQRKWTHWLAMMSYRFALRLGQLEFSESLQELKRSYRQRQRTLLRTSLDLLMELSDMDGGDHETIRAAVNEHLGDTFLREDGNAGQQQRQREMGGEGVVGTARVPYAVISVDSLGKAQDYLLEGIKMLVPLLEKTKRGVFYGDKDEMTVDKDDDDDGYCHEEQEVDGDGKEHNNENNNNHNHGNSSYQDANDNESSDEDVEREYDVDTSHNRHHTNNNNNNSNRKKKTIVTNQKLNNKHLKNPNKKQQLNKHLHPGLSLQLEALANQLFGLHHKLVNVLLRLTSHHLKSYWSSSAMQSLRLSSRHLASAVSLLRLRGLEPTEGCLCQYAWLWEFGGHFARSFAADRLWRERGHACGDDVVSLLRDVERACDEAWDESSFRPMDMGETTKMIGESVTLQSLTVLMKDEEEGEDDCGSFLAAKEVLDGQQPLKRDKWKVLVASVLCYGRAISALPVPTEDHHHQQQQTPSSYPLESRSHLLKRLGDASNEIGKILLSHTKSLLSSPQPTTTTTTQTHSSNNNDIANILLHSAQFWFQHGLDAFTHCLDLRNIALLRCNLCQCHKIRANAQFTHLRPKNNNNNSQKKNDPERSLSTAAHHLQKAHEALQTRDNADPHTWDMVSEELAATFLVLGVRRRQSLLGGGLCVAPVILPQSRLAPGEERSIVQPMMQALEIYGALGNGHQKAAVHYQLALFYAKIWTCQRNEKTTRDKLSKAFMHYGQAHGYFFRHVHGNEPTFVILSLDLSHLYLAVNGEECLRKALDCCLDTCEAFSERSVRGAKGRNDEVEWNEKMVTLAGSIEERVFKILQSLVKIEKEKSLPIVTTAGDGAGHCSNHSEMFKQMYRLGLVTVMDTKKKMSSSTTSTTMMMRDGQKRQRQQQTAVYEELDDDGLMHFPVHTLLTKLRDCYDRNTTTVTTNR